jgi:hypothetical protein
MPQFSQKPNNTRGTLMTAHEKQCLFCGEKITIVHADDKKCTKDCTTPYTCAFCTHGEVGTYGS